LRRGYDQSELYCRSGDFGLKVIRVKKSTERKRIKRMSADARRLFLNGLVGSTALDKINSYLKAAEKKV